MLRNFEISSKPKMSSANIKRESSSEDESCFEDVQPVVDVASTPANEKFKFKCALSECERRFNNSDHLRVHYRSHTNTKPYKCSYPACQRVFTILSSLINHICTVHQQTKDKAKKFVEKQEEILIEEAKQLGIKDQITEKEYDESQFDYNNETMPVLPHFTVILRISSGQYVCPVCDHYARNMNALKRHYRTHCKSQTRPFQCGFFPCRFGANARPMVEYHIRLRHFSEDNAHLKASDFVKIHTDWLEMENALFTSAQIVNPPNILQRIQQKTLNNPYKCTYPNCGRALAKKENILFHIHAIHFKVPRTELRNLSKEEKEAANQYVEVDKSLINIKTNKSVLHRKKKGSKEQNSHLTKHNSFGYESLDVTEAEFDGATTEDEDDEKELLALLVSVRSATFE